MLDIDSRAVPRFRDCYLARSSTGELEIHLYTRSGGDNREDLGDQNRNLTQHPSYISDEDAKHDPTYAIFRFRIPSEFIEGITSFVAETPDAVPRSPAERFEEFLEAMTNRPDDPEVRRVAEVVKPVFEEIASGNPDKKIFDL
jgi:hypothetical protein